MNRMHRMYRGNEEKFVPSKSAPIIFKILLMLIIIMGIAVWFMGQSGITPVYSMLFDMIVLFGLLNVMILAILEIRKRIQTDKNRRIATGVLVIITFLAFAVQFIQVSTMGTVLRSEYARIDSDHGRYVVVRTFLSVPEGTTLEEIVNDNVAEEGVTTYNYYCMYEAFPEVMGFFYDEKVTTEGMVIARIDMETGNTAQLLVDWEDDHARFYIKDGTPEENGELLVYYK